MREVVSRATAAQAANFIATIGPIIQKYAKSTGYKIASTVIAQACCESAFGTCALSPYHNYFGMKCGSSWKGKSVNMKTKEEYTVGTLTTIKDNFRAYDSMEEGVAGYYGFISAKRYANLKTATTYREYAEMLKADGYATSSTYVNTLCSLVEKYNLTVWDNFDKTVEAAPVQETPVKTIGVPAYRAGANYTLQAEMRVRTGPGTSYPAKTNAQLTTDGRKHDKDRDGCLDKGTVVTCLEVKNLGTEIWIRCPSGWIAAYRNGEIYAR